MPVGAPRASARRRYAASGLARDLLATVDNLRRAIASVPVENAAEPAVQQLVAGVEATERALLDALGKHGIRRIEARGGPFDPDRHEAVFEVTGSEHPEGIVAECSRRVTCTTTGCCDQRWSGWPRAASARPPQAPTTTARQRRRPTAQTDAFCRRSLLRCRQG